jgi:hypothetical protein
MASFAAQVPGVSTDVQVGGLSSAGVIPVNGRFSVGNPLTWVLIIGGVTFGAIGLSTHARFGPFKVSGSAGRNA